MSIPFLNNIIVDDSGHIQFKTAAGVDAGKINQDGNDLVLTNAVGDILLGDGASDVYIGDGTNNVDIIFEQSGAIKGDGSAVTLTLGGANTTLNLENPNINGSVTLPTTTINSKMTFGTSSGYILFDYEPSGDTGAYEGNTSVPMIKVDRAGSELTVLERTSENGAILLGNDDSVIIAAGDTRSTMRANINEGSEEVIFAAEGGFSAYGFPNNMSGGWSARQQFRFYTGGTTIGNNGLYIGSGGDTQFIDLSRNLKNIGNITLTGTVDGVDIAARDAVLTTTTNTANAAAPKASPTFTGEITIPNKIIHAGDTNTYMQFEAADVWRVVTGGTERLDINNNRILVGDGMMMQYDSISTSNSGTVIKGGFLNPASEANMVHIPHIVNDLAGFNKWSNATITTSGFYKSRSGSSGSYTYSNEVQASDSGWANAFDAHSSTTGSWYSDNGSDGVYQHGTDTPGVVELEWTNEAQYSLWAGIVFGSGSFTPTYVKIEAYRASAWQTLCEITDNTDQVVLRQVSGNSGTNAATRRLRYTLGGSVNNSYFRIHSLYMVNYAAGNLNLNNTGVDTTRGVNFLERYKDGYLHGHLRPGKDDTYDLGSSTYQWANGYFDQVVYADGLDIGGNIAVSGTVDGVDISALPTSFAPTNAEANVQADWTETTTTSDSFILNKPSTFPPSSHNHDGRYLRTHTRYSDDLDTINTSGVYIWDVSEADDEPTGASDGLLTIKYWDSSSWATASFQDFHNRKLHIKSKKNGTWQTDWAQVWTTDQLTTTNKTNYDTAYTHSQAAHAPTDAEANVQADWTETTTTSDAFILNKPTTFPPSTHNHDGRYPKSDVSTAADSWDSTEFSQYTFSGWDANGADWTPSTGWYWGLTLPHVSNTSSYNYSGQIAIANTTSAEMYVRTISNGTENSWKQVYHEGHKPTFAEISTTPTTLAGYGITDAAPSTVVNQTDFVSATNGGTFSGAITIEQNGDALNLRSTTNGQPANLTFSTNVPDSQIGHIKYSHSNSASYGSGESFVIGGTETSMTILADGKLMYKDGIYKKPSSGTGAGTRKDSNWDTAYTHSQAAHAPTDAEANVQADWNETTNTSDAFILNKPALPTDFVSKANGGDFSGQIGIKNGNVWSTSTQGLSTGSLHIDPEISTDHGGGAITFGASDASNGTNAQAGIYIRSDGSYGTRMYFSTTDSYATGSKSAMYINHNKDVYFLDDIDVAGDITLSGSGVRSIKSGGDIALKTSTGEYALYGAANGNTNLYYNGVRHFRTGPSGVVVTGSLESGAGNFSGDLEIAKTDPKLIFYDNSGANTTPNGEIVFSEVDNTENFKLRYNGTNDRFEYRGLVGSTDTLLGYWNRSTDTSLHVVGSISTGSDGNSDNWNSAYTFSTSEFLADKHIYTPNENGSSGSGYYMPMVKGGVYTTSDTTKTGYLKIKVPSFAANQMMSFTVDIYEYNSDRSQSIKLGGYNYASSSPYWYNTFAIATQDSDNRNLNVRYITDDTNDEHFILIGESDTNWTYPQVVVRDWLSGYSTSLSEMTGSWDIDFVTTFTGNNNATHSDNHPYAHWNRIEDKPSTFTPSSHNHDDRYYTETELNAGQLDNRYYTEAEMNASWYNAATTRSKFTTTDGTQDDYTLKVSDEGNLSGNKWYHVATTTSGNGGLHMRGFISNHVEAFAAQKFDLAIQVRQGNNGGQLEINGSVDVFDNDTATNDTDKVGVRVVKSAENGTYDEFKVYIRTCRYSMAHVRMTKEGNSFTFNTNGSSVTTEPAPVTGGHLEIDTSNGNSGFTEGNHLITDSQIVATFATTTIGGINGTTLYNKEDNLVLMSGGSNGTNLQLNDANGEYVFTSGDVKINEGSLSMSSDGSNHVVLSESGSGDFKIDANGDITLDANGADIILKDNNLEYGGIRNFDAGNLILACKQNIKDIIFEGRTSTGTPFTALTLDMSQSGKAIFNNDVVAYSDKKLKKDIKTLDGSKVYDMRGVSFTRKDNGEVGSGVVAQEMQEVAPELVSETDGTLGVSYGNITGYLIEAIKDLKQEVEELKKQIKNGNNL